MASRIVPPSFPLPPDDDANDSNTVARHTRSFSCRDASWAALERLAKELDCSTDQLINEAIGAYLRDRPQRLTPPPAEPSQRLTPTPGDPAQRRPPPLPPALPRPPAMPPPAAVRLPPGHRMVIVYNGRRFPVAQDRFVIGRGAQVTDLTLEDTNVSRQHAMIERVDGQHFIVDMGSTNGIVFQGQRIARRAIAPGDVYFICNHQLSFTHEPAL